jgi:hypothetical protein
VLTEKGRELGFVIGALATWGSRHVHPSTALVSEDCGHEVQLRYFCPACSKRVRGSTVRVRRRARTKTVGGRGPSKSKSGERQAGVKRSRG